MDDGDEVALGEVGVLGAGLIGGSVARRLVSVGASVHVHDPDPDALAGAAGFGAVTASEREVLERCDLVVLGVAPTVGADLWCERIVGGGLPPPPSGRRRLVVDVSSVKAPVLERLAGVGVPTRTRAEQLLLTHPMAGREVSGWNAGDAELFDGAAWIVCPPTTATGRELARTLAFVRAVGAQAAFLSPETHDRFAAAVSHLPHVLAFAMASLLDEHDPDRVMRSFAGGSLRDLLRVADASPRLWTEILAGNREQVARLVTAIIERVRDTAARGPSVALRDVPDAERAARSGHMPSPDGAAVAAPVERSLPLDVELGETAVADLVATGEAGLQVGAFDLDGSEGLLRLRLTRREPGP